tara:strand:+ start:43 stop:930 length:888 start_codon:yes stop_codon:yes gene_type:complete
MSYIGNQPAESYASFEKQVFTIVNSQTAYTLNHAVTNENEIRLVINNVVQEPGSGKAFTASGTTLTLSAALVNGTDEMYCVFLGRALQTVNPPNASVGSAQIADNLISGKTALASEPADTDEFLVSDAGTLKRIDYSLIKGGGITMADSWRINSNFVNSSGTSDITANWERVDTDGYGVIGTGLTESSGIFSFPSTGIYLITTQTSMESGASLAYAGIMIKTTTNNSSYAVASETYQTTNASGNNLSTNASFTFDVTNTSNDKFKLSVQNNNSCTYQGGTSQTITGVSVIRLGDT